MKGIEAFSLCKSFGEPPTQVLKDISLTIETGEFISITGRSGSGKSTLLYILSSLDPATSGSVKLLGKDLMQLSQKELHMFRNENMGFVFQFHHLLPELTALENVLMPAIKTERQDERREYAKKLLTDFGLGTKFDRFPRQLSGGEQQRVAIARSLVMQPKFVFADEPTGNLDSANGKTVLDIFKKINAEQGTTIIYVTHDREFAAMAPRRIHLVDGQLAAAD